MIPRRRNHKRRCLPLRRVHERSIRIVSIRISLNNLDYRRLKESLVKAGLVVSRGDYPMGNLVRFEYSFCKTNVGGNTIIHGLTISGGFSRGRSPFEDD